LVEVGVFCAVEGDNILVLGGGNELLLIEGWLQGGDLGKSLSWSLADKSLKYTLF